MWLGSIHPRSQCAGGMLLVLWCHKHVLNCLKCNGLGTAALGTGFAAEVEKSPGPENKGTALEPESLPFVEVLLSFHQLSCNPY